MTDRMVDRGVAAGLVSAMLMLPAAASADAVLDGTTGSSGSFAGDFEIPAAVGRQEGGNLFHSFARFSVLRGESATFTGPAGIDNVISRVTGGEVSTIDGLLASTIPGADFFFLNPAGVVFGPDASLSIDGSFHVSTADELRFADGARFSASDPSASSFTVAAPEAFGFLGADAGRIEVNGSVLAVSPNERLEVSGGDIDISGGVLFADSGTIDLTARGGDGDVAIRNQALVSAEGEGGGRVHIRARNLTEDRSAIVAPSGGAAVQPGGVDIQLSGDLVLTQSLIRAGSFGGPTDGVMIDAANVVLENQSTIANPNSGATDRSGKLSIEADAVTIDTDSLVAADVFGSGAGGELSIKADAVTIDTGSQVTADVFGSGAGGKLSIKADAVTIDTGSQVTADVEVFGSGAGGELSIKAEAVTIDTGSRVSTDVEEFGSGAGGELVVQADKVVVADGGEISSSTSGDGHAGEVAVTATGMLEVRRGGVISSGTEAEGNGGTVMVKAGRLVVSGQGSERLTGITGQANPGSAGKAGVVDVHATRLELRDGAEISSATFGPGAAGTVKVQVEGLLHIDGEGDAQFSTGISTSADFSTFGGQVLLSTGKAGTVDVRAGALEIREGGEISSSTSGTGDAGDVLVEATRRLLIDGEGGTKLTGISTSAPGGTAPNGQLVVGNGDGGSVKVTVTAGALEIRDGGEISSFTSGEGDAGTVTVRAGSAEIVGPAGVFTFAAAGDAGSIILKATDTLRISGDGTINSVTGGSGEGGTIVITADRVELERDGLITTRSLSAAADAGTAGGIVLNSADSLNMRSGARITAETAAAEAGDIEISAGELVEVRESAITTSVAGGQGSGGNIFIDPEFVVLDSGRIVAQAREGAGGNIRIIADHFFTTPGSEVDASSELGIDGTVEIDAPDVDLTSELAVLSTAFIDVSGLLRESCAARASDQTSSFVTGGSQGLVPDPAAPLAGAYAARAPRDAGFQHWTLAKASACDD